MELMSAQYLTLLLDMKMAGIRAYAQEVYGISNIGLECDAETPLPDDKMREFRSRVCDHALEMWHSLRADLSAEFATLLTDHPEITAEYIRVARGEGSQKRLDARGRIITAAILGRVAEVVMTRACIVAPVDDHGCGRDDS